MGITNIMSKIGNTYKHTIPQQKNTISTENIHKTTFYILLKL